ncbi:MAG: HPr family phosphocarrier protein [Planctomycetota bacterium]|jgi:phosphotransferase system HPr-like phosphotransfer protein|nr:HPr family phosphocarrier protein [Planctomycetota bacterium]MDP6762692.1 HPr family phosphocarrier protein [Planctomycetota bacterium]MDP6988944.1 HPr family phosphocarrier protein [Planctomycetota bacterium]
MSETSIDEIVTEQAFTRSLSVQGEMFFRLANSMLGLDHPGWSRRHLYQVVSEAHALESFLDDHGARDNRTFHQLRELVASIRGLAQAGFCLRHLSGRLESYGVQATLSDEAGGAMEAAIVGARDFVEAGVGSLLKASREEAEAVGVRLPSDGFPSERYLPDSLRSRLPRNLGEEVIDEEAQRIAEVASKYLQVSEMFDGIGVRPLADPEACERFLSQRCTEEQARVYEATVHNLQSAYDTHIKNTVLEGEDDRLPRLRGHASAALHLLEAVTLLAHFVERHEASDRQEGAVSRIDGLVSRREVRDLTLNALLCWAQRLIEMGRPLAEDLLPSYTNVQELAVELEPGLVLHARPMSLIVRIVGHHGTPVEMEVGGTVCNAGSIMDLMVAVGSNAASTEFRFRGDEHPLRDIGALFEHSLGEGGLSTLPDELSYLRDS